MGLFSPAAAPHAAPPRLRNPTAYEQHKTRAAARSRDQSAADREIAPLPKVANPTRRRQAVKSLRRFCELYLWGAHRPFNSKWGKAHLELMAAFERAAIAGDVVGVAMPRGSGKTTLAIAAVLWAILTGRHRFIMCIGANKSAAMGLLQKLTAIIQGNEDLAADFPEWLYPFQCQKGINQARPLWHGARLTLSLKKTEIIFARLESPVPGKPPVCPGAIIRCAGLLSADIRGQLWGTTAGEFLRPSLFFADDPQTEQSAKSEKQNETRERILAADVLGMAGPGKALGGMVACTVIARDDMADRILDRKRHPEYNGHRYKMLEGLRPEKELDYLRRYGDARSEGLRRGDGGRQANAYWRKHRKELEKGLTHYWPARFKPTEVCAIQSAINRWLDDRRAFYSECQNDPTAAEQTNEATLTAAAIIVRRSGRPRGVLPSTVQYLAAGIDVHDDLLYWTVLGTEESPTGYVIDYGAWPDQRRTYFLKRDASPNMETFLRQRDRIERDLPSQVYAALETLIDDLAGRTWAMETGGAMSLGKIVIDTGHLPDVVYRAAKQSRHASIILPAYGAKPATFHRDGRKKTALRFGEDYFIAPPGQRPLRHAGLNSAAWITRVHNGFLAPRGASGAWNLFDDDPHAHQCFADHITAETFTDWTDDRTGRKERRWQLIPGRDNHWLDTTKMAAVGCFELGCRSTFGKPAPLPPPTQKRAPRISYH